MFIEKLRLTGIVVAVTTLGVASAAAADGVPGRRRSRSTRWRLLGNSTPM